MRKSEKDQWTWYCSAGKMFMRDRTGNPFLVITTAIPIDAKHHLTPKVERIVQENNFLLKNKKVFAGLTKREKQILKFMAPGLNSGEIAETLHHQVIKQKGTPG